MSQLPAHRRSLDFRDWNAVLSDVDHLRRVGYRRAGNWDLSQILEHVGEGLRTASRGNEHQGAWVIRRLIGPLLLKRILRQRRMQAGIKVPQWWLPGPQTDESDSVAKFRDDLAVFQALTTQPFPHPFFGPLSKQQWTELALIHAAHHLSFLIPQQ